MPYGLFDYVPDSGIHTMGVQTCADCPEGYMAVCQPPKTVSPAPAPVPPAVPPSMMPKPSCPQTARMPNLSAQIHRQVGADFGDFLELVTNPTQCMLTGGCVNINGCMYKALPRTVSPPTERPSPPVQAPPPWMPIMPSPPTPPIRPPVIPPITPPRACPLIALPSCPKGQYRTGECGLGPCTGTITPAPAPVPTPPSIRPPVIRPPINTGPIFYPSPYPSPNNPYADNTGPIMGWDNQPPSTPITAPRAPQPMPLPAPAPAPAPIKPQPIPVSSGQGVGNLIGGQRPPNYGQY